MPKIPSKEQPDNLKPYIFHGVDLEYGKNDKEALGDCPFCKSEYKFSVKIETGQGRCFKCSEGMNATSFLKKMYEKGFEETEFEEYENLAQDRGVAYPETLISWGLFLNYTSTAGNRNWIVPGYTFKDKTLKLTQLYKYLVTDKIKLLLPTPTMGHKLFGLNLFDPNKPENYICEGPWDAMVLWETLSRTKIDEEGKYSSTSNIKKSLLADANVLGVPGCGTFFEDWAGLFEDSTVYILFDSDKPVGENSFPAGFNGMKRIVRILTESNTPPESINYLKWGEEGYDKSLPRGYDIRDLLNQDGVENRLKHLPELYDKLRPVDEDWLSNPSEKAKSNGQVIEPVDCSSYKQMINAWKKALKWTDGLDAGLSVMLASSMSTNLIGEQLWFKIIGPPSCGKTTLIEGLAINKKYVLSKDTIRGFYSGWKTPDGKDHSIAALVKGKTLATKDGDTLLKAPDMEGILSEARGLYDRCGRTHYKNDIAHEYEGHRMTWLLCGTSALREIDDSELGARFLDVVIMDEIDEEFEADVAWRVANQESNAMLVESNGKAESRNPEVLTKAMQLTGGYLGYLRENVEELMSRTEMPPDILMKITHFAKFIAIMRARPGRKRTTEAEADREFSARLVKQLVRLCRCLVVVMNRSLPDVDVMKTVFKVTKDTSRGQGLEIVKRLYNEDGEGLALNAISVYTNHTDTQTGTMLRFLHRLKVVKKIQVIEKTRKAKIRKLNRWDLTNSTKELYRIVMEE